ncbi:MAG TPA: helix-turn-helix domain-containing protein [Acidimicrobiales bacterium]|jgi:DNA-binding transcriptional ArsR family regulator|nr:helix-turn-helix domain-containing protein [Acidimicrobiales bacterium]
MESVPTPNDELPIREITDARTMRALAHPVRIALIEALTLNGPMTATQVGERIGESPTTCSFHLRQLAKYGFVEEAGGGKGRSRPWRITSVGMRFGYSDDAETDVAASLLGQLFRERQLARYWAWRNTRGDYPKPWREASGDSEFVFYLTAEELEDFNEELNAFLLPKFRERLMDASKRPANAVPVELLLFSYPMELPQGGEES